MGICETEYLHVRVEILVRGAPGPPFGALSRIPTRDLDAVNMRSNHTSAAVIRLQIGLSETDLEETASVLSDAFARYPVELSFSSQSLRRMCAVDDVRLDASVLARGPEGHLLGVSFTALRGQCGRIAAMGVVRDSHRRGVGRALGQAALGSLRAAGAERVILEALTINTPALALYEGHLGFARTRRLIGFTRAGGGTPVEQTAWEAAMAAGAEMESWQLPRVIESARSQTDLVELPPVVPEEHPVAELLRVEGFIESQVDQYELARCV